MDADWECVVCGHPRDVDTSSRCPSCGREAGCNKRAEVIGDDQINADLAKKIGPEAYDMHGEERDFVRSENASSRLEDWLLSHGYDVKAETFAYLNRSHVTVLMGMDCAMVLQHEQTVQGKTSAARRRALALAAYKALCGGAS